MCGIIFLWFVCYFYYFGFFYKWLLLTIRTDNEMAAYKFYDLQLDTNNANMQSKLPLVYNN